MIQDKSLASRLFDGFIVTVLVLVAAASLYPFLYVISLSVSEPDAIRSNLVFLYPVGFLLDGYQLVMEGKMILVGFRTSVFIVLAGTTVNMIMTVLTAYPLSKSRFILSNFWMMAITFTMYFGGGLIPTYLLVRELGLVNSYWALILPGAISSFNMIIMRTFFKSIPKELEESAVMDGGGDFIVLTRIVLPLSKASLATISLFYAVAHWNDFFAALIYIKEPIRYPLQLMLRELLFTGNMQEATHRMIEDKKAMYFENVKYATLVLATLPILLVYPFLQRYFIRGVMIGALKG